MMLARRGLQALLAAAVAMVALAGCSTEPENVSGLVVDKVHEDAEIIGGGEFIQSTPERYLLSIRSCGEADDSCVTQDVEVDSKTWFEFRVGDSYPDQDTTNPFR
jgi:hypothetical protein